MTELKIALLFPGQGSQSVGMGRDLADNYPAARAVFEEADDALGFALSDIIFNGPDDQLKLTEHTQPAILTVSTAAWRVLAPELAARGLQPAFAAGHSLGEYSANVAAGTFSFADAVRIVRLRGRFMQEAVPPGEGAMAAILGLDAATINDVCAQVSDELTEAPAGNPADPTTQAFAAIDAVTDPHNSVQTLAQAASRVNAVVSPANMNSPSQVAISGTTAAVQLAMERCKAAGAKKVLMLHVSAPFHCALMQPARQQLASELESVAFNDPAFPVAANVDARLLHRGPDVRDALIRQVTGAVRWVECIRLLQTEGATQYIEVGPGKVLSGLNRQIDREFSTSHVEDQASLAKCVANLDME
jgi:[acyl-carrier-protein] S-malonyltransferase